MGQRSDHSASRRGRWPHRLAIVTAAATLLLIFVGGLVTNTGSALAVPDWPTTFGYNMFLYPWSQMVGGIFYEHSHRLIGSTVGLLTVALAVSLWLIDARRSVRVLALVAVVAVLTQGVLGGLRVVLLQQPLAIVHGCLAQAFFALLVSLAVMTSPFWESCAAQNQQFPDARLGMLARVTASLVYLQTVFGALLTHTGTRLDAHLLCGVLVAVSASLLAAQVLRHHASRVELRRPALLLLALLVAQLTLGLGVYLWRFTSVNEAMSAGLGLALQTTHRVSGTAMLGAAVAVALRVARLTAAGRAVLTPDAAGDEIFIRSPSAGRGREVLA